jgi:hypothetical protein
MRNDEETLVDSIQRKWETYPGNVRWNLNFIQIVKDYGIGS